MADQTTGVAANGAIPIFYRRFGSAGRTPLVIVHGLSYFSYDWIGIGRALAADRAVLALDLRGFGDSAAPPDGDYSVPANARDIVAVLDHVGWPRAVLMGHSMGGRHCLYAASTYPDRAAALIAVDFAPTVDPKGQARVAQSVGTQPDRFDDVDAAIEWLTRAPAAAATEDIRRRVEAYTRPAEGGGVTLKRALHFRDQFRRILETGQRPAAGVDLWKVLADLRAPALFVRGRRSDMFAQDTARKVVETAPVAEVVEVDTGHDVGGEDPDALIGVVRTFLGRHEL